MNLEKSGRKKKMEEKVNHVFNRSAHKIVFHTILKESGRKGKVRCYLRIGGFTVSLSMWKSSSTLETIRLSFLRRCTMLCIARDKPRVCISRLDKLNEIVFEPVLWLVLRGPPVFIVT